jgi:hypothetical protein
MEREIAIEVVEHLADDLVEYARIPIAYEVRHIFDVVATASGLGGLMMVERSIGDPYLKDYDAIPDEGPLTWPRRFNLSNWRLFMARVGDRRVGGAAVILNGIPMPNGAVQARVRLRLEPATKGCWQVDAA